MDKNLSQDIERRILRDNPELSIEEIKDILEAQADFAAGRIEKYEPYEPSR